jgi:hypothetical protein
MIHREIINKKTGQRLISFVDCDFEYVKPIKHYEEDFIVKHMILSGITNEELLGEVQKSEKSKAVFIEANLRWRKRLEEFKSLIISNQFIKLLETKKKSEQEDLLQGLVLTPEILMGIIIKADELGYTLSQYRSEHSSKGIDHSKMPLAFEVKEDGNVKTYGETELSNGQLKQAIEHRKVKVAKILDRGTEWHCFFTTYKSLRGEETWLGEKQPHFHYISNAFMIDRTEVIKQIKSEKYKLGNLPHIKLEEYGKQPE